MLKERNAMASKKHEVIVYFYKLPDVHKYWGWFFAIGILLIALGVLAIGYANWATEFTVILLGFLLAGAGILQIINGVYALKWTGFSLSLLLGLLYVIAGVLCIFKPVISAESISLLIAALLLIGGSFRLFSALRYRFDNWVWVVFNGFIAILLGILILAEWPASALWVIGLFVGIDLLLMGCYWVRLSLAARK
jgi:uncharacterized membrane protein HdeD (DUF308 family)